jgi:hypothetical protein
MFVTPAKAGIQKKHGWVNINLFWIPAPPCGQGRLSRE